MDKISNERKAQIFYQGNGTQTQYSFPFDYLRKAFVHVSLISDEKIEELTQGKDYTVNDRVVTLVAPTGLKIKIYRVTTTKPLVGWADASVLKAADMTVQSTQLLHLAEETSDLAQEGGLSKDGTDNIWDARYNKIKNLLDPTEPGDAVNLNYITKNQTSLLTQLNNTGAAQNASIVSTGDTQNARLTATGDNQNTRLTSTGDTQNKRLTDTGDSYVATMTTLKDTATDKVTEATNQAALAKKWAVSETSPDGVTGSKSSKVWADTARSYASNAATSEANASKYESSANTYKKQAADSATTAASKASESASSASSSATSASNAATSEANAKLSETKAADSAAAAAKSATNMKLSETKAADSASSSATSASNAATSATNAKLSETKVADSATTAAKSATNAKLSETKAADSATTAASKASEAASSASASATSASNASTSASNAKISETKAASSAAAAAQSAIDAAKFDPSSYYLKDEVDHRIANIWTVPAQEWASMEDESEVIGGNLIIYDSEGSPWLLEYSFLDYMINNNLDLSAYALKANIPTKTSQLTNDSGFAVISNGHLSINGSELWIE